MFVCRFCKYPHELLLRLDRPAKLQQIQILAHEFKVRACALSMKRPCSLEVTFIRLNIIAAKQTAGLQHSTFIVCRCCLLLRTRSSNSRRTSYSSSWAGQAMDVAAGPVVPAETGAAVTPAETRQQQEDVQQQQQQHTDRSK